MAQPNFGAEISRQRLAKIWLPSKMVGLPMVNGQYLAWPLKVLIQTRSK